MTARHYWQFDFGAGDVGASCKCGVARYMGANVGAIISPDTECEGETETTHVWQRQVVQGRLIVGCAQCGIVRMGRCRDPWEPLYDAPVVDLGGWCGAVPVPA